MATRGSNASSVSDARLLFGSPTLTPPAQPCVKCIIRAGYPAAHYALYFRRSAEPEPDHTDLFARFVAAEINNRLVATGDRLLALETTPDLEKRIRRTLQFRYGQYEKLTLMLKENAAQPSRSLSIGDLDPGNIPQGGILAGINIGQTLIKGYSIDSAMEIERRLSVPVDKGETQGTRAESLRSSAMHLMSELAGGDPERISCLGLSVGGMVHENTILPHSGITLGLTYSDLRLIQALPETMSVHANAPVHVRQDVDAKAQFHAALGHRECLVIDVGTSLGGCYIADGTVPPYLNQVGRIAWDLSPSARWRPDGLGAGLLSSYLSAKGFMASAGTGLPHIRQPRDLEDDLRVERAPGLRVAQRFCRMAAEALALICSYYRPGELVLTGGLMSGTLGRLVLDECQGAPPLPRIVTISPDPLFDSAVGVAWCALSMHRQQDLPA
jgi:predicted NBD/HSP70 family sugar kinase